MTIIGLVGYAQSGKDTAAGILAEYGFKRLAFADAIRKSLYALDPVIARRRFRRRPDRLADIVDRYGWEYAKTQYPEVRRLLQCFGTEVGRDIFGEMFWVDLVMNQINLNEKYVITDVRFHNEEQAIHAAGGKVFRILRPGVDPVNSHISDNQNHLLAVDGIIHNDGDMDDLKVALLEALKDDLD